jgi:hypothetical protein
MLTNFDRGGYTEYTGLHRPYTAISDVPTHLHTFLGNTSTKPKNKYI